MWNDFFFLLPFLSFFDEKHGNVILVSSEKGVLIWQFYLFLPW